MLIFLHWRTQTHKFTNWQDSLPCSIHPHFSTKIKCSIDPKHKLGTKDKLSAVKETMRSPLCMFMHFEVRILNKSSFFKLVTIFFNFQIVFFWEWERIWLIGQPHCGVPEAIDAHFVSHWYGLNSTCFHAFETTTQNTFLFCVSNRMKYFPCKHSHCHWHEKDLLFIKVELQHAIVPINQGSLPFKNDNLPKYSRLRAQ